MYKRNENRSELIANWGLEPVEPNHAWESPGKARRAVKRDVPLWGYVVAGILALSGFSSIVMTILGVGIY